MNATLVGFMDFVPAEGRIQRLRLITEKAMYVDQDFSAALRSVSRETWTRSNSRQPAQRFGAGRRMDL